MPPTANGPVRLAGTGAHPLLIRSHRPIGLAVRPPDVTSSAGGSVPQLCRAPTNRSRRVARMGETATGRVGRLADLDRLRNDLCAPPAGSIGEGIAQDRREPGRDRGEGEERNPGSSARRLFRPGSRLRPSARTPGGLVPDLERLHPVIVGSDQLVGARDGAAGGCRFDDLYRLDVAAFIEKATPAWNQQSPRRAFGKLRRIGNIQRSDRAPMKPC